jgi:Cu-Zn family superoxide dismutase
MAPNLLGIKASTPEENSMAAIGHAARRTGPTLLTLFALAGMAGCEPPPPTLARADVDRGGNALARIVPTAGSRVNGTATFQVEDDGTLAIRLDLKGLDAGIHGFHIHEMGDCSAPDASSAGEHFAPDGDPHGPPEADNDAHHAGDLGNIVADSSGSVVREWTDDELTLEGTYGVVGRAVIVHAQADDLETQPSGQSGDPIACGVIVARDGTSAPL